VLALAGVSAPVSAGDHRCKADVDLHLGHAQLQPAGSDWSLSVEYSVEVEDAAPSDRFVVVFQLRDCDQLVLDEKGQPLSIVVPLETPARCDDDEREFEGRPVFTLPAPLIRAPDKLRLEAAAYYEGDNRPLDGEDTRVKYCPPVQAFEPAVIDYGAPILYERPAPVVVEPPVFVQPCPPVVVERPVFIERPAPIFVHRYAVGVVNRCGPVVGAPRGPAVIGRPPPVFGRRGPAPVVAPHRPGAPPRGAVPHGGRPLRAGAPAPRPGSLRPY
jgi:hypothetical protein